MMRTLSIALMLALASSCAKKKEEPKEEPKVSAEEAAKEAKEAKEKAAKAKEEEIAALVKEIKTKEDFEEQASTEITEENLEAELAKLEQQLDVEAPDTAGTAAASAPSLRPALPKPVTAKSESEKKPATP
jgi:hypothetical protein